MQHPRLPPHHRYPTGNEDDEPLVESGRSLGLRLSAGQLGSLSFPMIWNNSLVPLIQPPSRPTMPDQRDGSIT